MELLSVERRGTGTPVLLLHGLLSDRTQVYPLLPALTGCEAFIPDLLGCGESDKTPGSRIVQENARMLKALCKQHGIKTVICYSVSGLIGIELGLPNTVFISCFCTNPTAVGYLRPLHGREQQATRILANHRERAHAFVATLRSGTVPGIKRASMACAIDYMLQATEDWTAKAARLKRCLVVHGTDDKLINYQLGAQLAAACHTTAILVPETHASILRNATVHEAITRFVKQT